MDAPVRQEWAPHSGRYSGSTSCILAYSCARQLLSFGIAPSTRHRYDQRISNPQVPGSRLGSGEILSAKKPLHPSVSCTRRNTESNCLPYAVGARRAGDPGSGYVRLRRRCRDSGRSQAQARSLSMPVSCGAFGLGCWRSLVRAEKSCYYDTQRRCRRLAYSCPRLCFPDVPVVGAPACGRRISNQAAIGI